MGTDSERIGILVGRTGGSGLIMQRDVHVYSNAETLAEGAAREIVHVLRRALEEGERASLVLTGGRTPRQTYAVLADVHRETLDWRRVDVFWGDERFVPPDHPESNYKMAASTLLSKLEVGEIYPVRTSVDSTGRSAEEYERVIREYFGDAEIRFDLTLLGLGEDAHVASLFPGSASLDESERLVVPTQAPDDAAVRDRVSMTFPALNSSRTALFLVSGESKRPAVRRVFAEEEGAPAVRVSAREQVIWCMDEAAADGVRA
jgi:6-phosphogluconolactonase